LEPALVTWRRFLLRTLLVVVVLGLLVSALVLFSLGHRQYEVDGALHVSEVASGGPHVPAVACLWANGFGMATPRADLDETDQARLAHVVCRIPAGGIDIPFRVSNYGVSGRGMLIGGYLQAAPQAAAVCSAAPIFALTLDDSDGTYASLCASGEFPPKSEIALAAPFDDDEGRPTKNLEIRVYVAE
jgi:hypothetical protein